MNATIVFVKLNRARIILLRSQGTVNQPFQKTSATHWRGTVVLESK